MGRTSGARCGKLHKPTDITPCRKPAGHESIERQQARARRYGQRGTRQTPKATKHLPVESPKQRERTSFLHGVKAERMERQLSEYEVGVKPGPWWCETCKQPYRDFQEAWAALTVSHIESRNDTSTRYERRREPDFRLDDPSNILLECRPCNNAREPQPEFGATG